MWIFWIALLLLAALAGGLGGLAKGFRDQRDDGREQIKYLRAELARVNSSDSAPAGSRALTVAGGRP